MANEFVTNKLADYVSVRAYAAAPYLTVGKKSYFADQIGGKITGVGNGQQYEFVKKDVGKVVEGLDITGQTSTLTEKKLTKSIEIENVMVETNAIEAITDIGDWDDVIAKPNGQALGEGIVAKVITKDIPLCNTAYFGKGWLPLSKASNFLSSVSSAKKFGFMDPLCESIVTSQGKAFTPADSEDLYKTGLVGNFAGTEWRMQQFIPQVSISADLAAELASATVSSYTQGATADTLTLSGVTQTIPAGTPIMVKGIYAANLIGNKTSALKAFIAMEDATSGAVKVAKVEFVGQGTKDCVKANGSAVNPASDFAGKKIVAPEAGDYYMGIVRCDGAFEFDTLKKLDFSNADMSSEGFDGLSILSARAVNVEAGTNKTRFSVAGVWGLVEGRAASLVLVKDVDVANAVLTVH